MPSGELKTKHLRAPIEDADGTRIYIARRWPRGVGKGERFTEWGKELAPSTDLLEDYLHGDTGWEAYKKRFLEQMSQEDARNRLDELARRVREGETITLLCDHPSDAPDDECHRFLVQRLVEQRLE